MEAIVLNVTWRDVRTGRTIMRVRELPRSFHTVTGTFAEVNLGDRFRFEGRWIQHSKYGAQFDCQTSEILPPDEKEILQRYLACGIFHGIGPNTAEKILQKFGSERTIDALNADPRSIAHIRGFGAIRAERFAIEWNHAAATRDDYLAMLRLHLPLSLVHRWIRNHGDKSLNTLRMQPFKLTEEPWDLGFQRADSIAKKMGLEPDAPERLRAALKYALERAAQDGHTHLPTTEAMTKAEDLLDLHGDENVQRIEIALADALDRELLIQTETCLYLPWLNRAERNVAEAIYQMLQRKSNKLSASEKKAWKEIDQKRGIKYSTEQKEAIRMAMCEPLMILTGGPGTGKTSTLQGILTLLEEREYKTVLAAPTGRAARRMEEVSGKSASTLHRLLEYQGETHQCGRNADRPLECDVLVIDECSMVDLDLMEKVMEALPRRATLILVGDQNQLPSVGPGSVLADLLAIEQIPRICLSQVFRQAEENDIPHNAQKILNGEIPHSLAKPTHFHLRQLQDHGSMQEKILDLVCQDIPNHFKCDPFAYIQVLCPIKRGQVGIEELNRKLQERLLAGVVRQEGLVFCVGDKVMQTRNNYDKDVFNGDIGIVREIDPVEQTLLVAFDQDVEYTWQEAEELTLAYAVTVHKSQGSEYPYVVLVLDPEQQGMLQRRLLYTAVTRAKERLFIVCRGDALSMAVNNRFERPRYSRLTSRIVKNLEFVTLMDEIGKDTDLEQDLT